MHDIYGMWWNCPPGTLLEKVILFGIRPDASYYGEGRFRIGKRQWIEFVKGQMTSDVYDLIERHAKKLRELGVVDIPGPNTGALGTGPHGQISTLYTRQPGTDPRTSEAERLFNELVEVIEPYIVPQYADKYRDPEPESPA